MDAVDLASAAQFALAHEGKIGRRGKIWHHYLPRLAAGSGHQVDLTALGGVLGEHPTRAKGFVVRVAEECHQGQALRSHSSRTTMAAYFS